jgi:hypothetical protein
MGNSCCTLWCAGWSQFTLTFETRIQGVAPLAVYDHLSDPRSFLGLQPLLRAVEKITPVPGGCSWESVEAVPICCGCVHLNRIAVVTKPRLPELCVAMEVSSPGGVTIDSSLTCVEDGSDTVVRQAFLVSAPRLLRAFVRAEASKAQLAMLANLKKRLEAAPVGVAAPPPPATPAAAAAAQE